MSDVTDYAEAHAFINLYGQPSVYPDVTADIPGILETVKRASTWVATGSYRIGDVVLPTDAKRNGHRYRLISYDGVGTAPGATEPVWPTSRDATVQDGNLTWREDGAEYKNIYDKRHAVYLVWITKASKVQSSFSTASGGQAGLKKFQEDGQSFEFEDSSGVNNDREFYINMARQFMPVDVG